MKILFKILASLILIIFMWIGWFGCFASPGYLLMQLSYAGIGLVALCILVYLWYPIRKNPTA